MKRNCCAFLLITFLVTASGAKNEPAITMLWPPDKPALKLGFDKFHQVSVYAGQSVFISDVTVQNLTDKQIPRAAFTVFPESVMGKSRDGENIPLRKLWHRRQTTKFNGISYIVQRGAEAVYSDAGKEQIRALIDHYMTNARLINIDMPS